MAVFEFRSTLPVSVSELFAWHARPGAFERLAAPWQRLVLLARSGGIRDGARVRCMLQRRPLRLRWETLYCDLIENRQFVDELVRGPLPCWRHCRFMRPQGDDASLLWDWIQYELPLGLAGRALLGGVSRSRLERLFAWRHLRTERDLLRHAAFRERPRLRVALGGASGLIGRQLAAFLTTGGHRVTPLVRSVVDTAQRGIRWHPDRDEIDARALEGFDAFVHLGGENIAGAAWTPQRKAALRESRIRGTALLARTIARLKQPPRTFICASATGYYGDRGDEALTEDSPPGEGFLPDLCREWEQAAAPAQTAGVRVVSARLGVVLSPSGGALARMLTPFGLGLGGRLGSGRQFMSWIALDDAVGALHYVLMNDALRGAVNLTAPGAVTNREFTRTLGTVLKRPTLAPVPAAAVRALFGEMGQRLLLEGANVVPRRLLDAGFEFASPDLEQALRFELGRF